MTQPVSLTLTTNRLAETRTFYSEHFQAETLFDCGWYITLRLGREVGSPELCLMEPQNEGQASFTGGVTLNLRIEDVDTLHETLVVKGGVPAAIPLEDHAWGDRGFCVVDPSGLRLYCYRDIPPAPEFQDAFKTPTAP